MELGVCEMVMLAFGVSNDGNLVLIARSSASHVTEITERDPVDTGEALSIFLGVLVRRPIANAALFILRFLVSHQSP